MKGGKVCSLLVVLCFVFISAEDQVLDVVFDGITVTLICPFEEPVEWYKAGKDKLKDIESTLLKFDNYTSKNSGWYYCEHNSSKSHVFIKAKVCESCVDVDPTLMVGCFVGDVIITLGVILIVYLCARSKAGSAPPQSAMQTRQRGAPLPPDSDYQRLNPATRSKDVYAEPQRKR